MHRSRTAARCFLESRFERTTFALNTLVETAFILFCKLSSFLRLFLLLLIGSSPFVLFVLLSGSIQVSKEAHFTLLWLARTLEQTSSQPIGP